MKVLLLIFCFAALSACAQKKPVKKDKYYEVCSRYEAYKGKKNHGKLHCVGWMSIKEDSNGKKDTIGWSGGAQSFYPDELELYQKLPERGKYICDSLTEDGFAYYQGEGNAMFLAGEARWMEPGKKKYKFYKIRGQSVYVMEYLVWSSSRGSGYELKKEYEVL